MHRYGYAAAVGFLAFIGQLAANLYEGLGELTDLPWAGEGAGAQFLHQLGQDSTWMPLLAYLVLGSLMHMLPLVVLTAMLCDLSRRSPRWARVLSRYGAHTGCLLLLLWLLAWVNCLVFPSSRALGSAELLFRQPASALLNWLAVAFALLVALHWLVAASSRARAGSLVVVTLLVVGSLDFSAWSIRKRQPDAIPDVFIIGVDSLRADVITGWPQAKLPTIRGFVGHSTHLSNATTPMARTFVAYMSVLTGQYPVHHGARENLYPSHRVDAGSSLAHGMRSAGYATLLAMDESRFADFGDGDAYGFDRTVTPPRGAVELLVAEHLDTVATNLLSVHPVAALLMPHLYGNRAAVRTYRPAAFDRRVGLELSAADPVRPLFGVFHYCMGHYPYALGAGKGSDGYVAALEVADVQVQRLLTKLKAQGRLDNAVVVLLSDHGEALGLAEDRWLADGQTLPLVAAYHGHGFPALDEAQSKVVLAFQRFRDGMPVWPATSSELQVSLVDVAPTMLDLAGVSSGRGDHDGRVLLDSDGRILPTTSVPVFVESGLTGSSMQKQEVRAGEVAREFIGLFAFDDSGALVLRDDALTERLTRKQRGVLFGDYGVSSWQDSLLGDCWMKHERASRRIQCLPLASDDAVVVEARELLCAHHAGDTDFNERWCRSLMSATSAAGVLDQKEYAF